MAAKLQKCINIRPVCCAATSKIDTFAKLYLPLIRKFFPLDKNYLLEEAQLALQDKMLLAMVEEVKLAYDRVNNPLGLEDSFTLKVKNYIPSNLKPLTNFYVTFAAAYRFKFSDNQLEFVWDGRDHLDKYHEEWPRAFMQWIREFCKQELFVQAVLDLTVFLPDNQQTDLAESRMNNFMLRQFGVKFHKTKGFVQMRVA
jgi:hypothetical protein